MLPSYLAVAFILPFSHGTASSLPPTPQRARRVYPGSLGSDRQPHTEGPVAG